MSLSSWLHSAEPIVAGLFGLTLGGVFLSIARLDPFSVYSHILQAGFGDVYALSDTAVKAGPIALCGLGASLAFRMNVWNIGGEGQLYIGAWAASGVALFVLPASTPSLLMIGSMIVAGFLGGALWAGVPGILRARFGINEIISTLMLNYIAFEWVRYFVYGPWSERGFQLTPQFPSNAWLPRLAALSSDVPVLAGLTLHAGLGFVLLIAPLLTWLFTHSPWGFETRAIGANPRASRHAGMNIERSVVVTMLVSGGLAGLAGMSEVAGVVHRLQDRFSPGYGFAGIMVAWLGQLRPWSIVVASFIFGGLLVGGKEIQPSGIPQMLEGLILFGMVGAQAFFRYRGHRTHLEHGT